MTILEQLKQIDRKQFEEEKDYLGLTALYEAANLTPQDKEEIKKVLQNTSDPETIAAVLAAKSQDENKNESLEEDEQLVDKKVWYDVFIKSPGGVKHNLTDFDTEVEAEDFCNQHDWHWVDENGFDWQLDYEEKSRDWEDWEKDESLKEDIEVYDDVSIGGDKDNYILLYAGVHLGGVSEEDAINIGKQYGMTHILWGSEYGYKGMYNGDMWLLYKDANKLPKGYKEDALKYGKEINESLNEDKVIYSLRELRDWIKDHKQATKDIERYYGKPVDNLFKDEIFDWLFDHEELFNDFKKYFGVNESLKEEYSYNPDDEYQELFYKKLIVIDDDSPGGSAVPIYGYEFKVFTDNIMDDLYEFSSKDNSDEASSYYASLSDLDWREKDVKIDEYLKANFNRLFEKYEEQLLDKYEYYAIEQANEDYNNGLIDELLNEGNITGYWCPNCHDKTVQSTLMVVDDKRQDGAKVLECDNCGKKFFISTKDNEIKPLPDYVKVRRFDESLNEKLVDAPQEVIDELLEILSNHGFVLDDSIKHENPMKTFMGDIHIQVINPSSYINPEDNIRNQLKEYITPDLIEEIRELDERTDCPITWNFGPNDENKVTGGLDIMKQYVEESLNEASYGGAYDIEDDMYFTRDDLNEFCDILIDKLNDKFGYSFDIYDAGFDSPTQLYIEVIDETHSLDIPTIYKAFVVDMRKIRKPSDLQKYIPVVFDYFVNRFEEEYNEQNFDESLNEDAISDQHKFVYGALNLSDDKIKEIEKMFDTDYSSLSAEEQKYLVDKYDNLSQVNALLRFIQKGYKDAFSDGNDLAWKRFYNSVKRKVDDINKHNEEQIDVDAIIDYALEQRFNESLMEDSDDEYEVWYYLNTAGAERRPEEPEDLIDFKYEDNLSMSDLIELFIDLDYVYLEDNPSLNDCFDALESHDFTGGGPIIYKINKNNQKMYDDSKYWNKVIRNLQELDGDYEESLNEAKIMFRPKEMRDWLHNNAQFAKEIEAYYGKPVDDLFKDDIWNWLSDNKEPYRKFIKDFGLDESLTEDIYEDDDGDYDDNEFEKGRDGCYYKYISSKSIYDSDGFTTDYTLYMKAEPVKDKFDVSFVTVFGDSDIYKPDDGNYDYETDDLDNAFEWFNSYNGFEDDLDESLNEDYFHNIEKLVRDATNKYELDSGEVTPAQFDAEYINDMMDEFENYNYSVGWYMKDPIQDSDDLSNQIYEFHRNDEPLEEDTIKRNGKWAYDVEPHKIDMDVYDIVFIDTGKRAHSRRFESYDDALAFIKRNAKYYNWIAAEKSELKNRELTDYGKKLAQASINEDTIKQNGGWVNKGKEGTHGKFATKKAADAQRKAMFANGYKESLDLKEGFTLLPGFEFPDGSAYYSIKKVYPSGYWESTGIGGKVSADGKTWTINGVDKQFGSADEMFDYLRTNKLDEDFNEQEKQRKAMFAQGYTESLSNTDPDKYDELVNKVFNNIKSILHDEKYKKDLSQEDLEYLGKLISKKYFTEGLQDIQNDFANARKNWDSLGFNISFDDALEKYNDKYGEERFYAKPIYDEDAWNQMVNMFSSKNESVQKRKLTFGEFCDINDPECNLSEDELQQLFDRDSSEYSEDEIDSMYKQLYGESLKLKEDYQHQDDTWGEPYTFKEVEADLKSLTNNWQEKEGALRCYWEQEKEYGKQILEKHYEKVEVSDGRTGKGENMSWVLSYSKPIE